MADRPITADLLEWPPDVFALTTVILARSEAFRFVLSPVGDWPPARTPDWEGAVGQAARSWGAWTEDHRGEIPALVTEEWRVLSERAGLPMDQLARGRDWRLCQALLTLHAIADEACAGLGVALDTSDATACVYRARGRELLARTGSIARIDPRWLRVLPKVRTPPTGRAAFSRYACVQGPGIEARWHKMPARHRGTDLSSEFATLLLLPWPLRVRTSDFRPIEGSVRRQAQEPYGFFEFAPRDGLDFDLLERVLAAARGGGRQRRRRLPARKRRGRGRDRRARGGLAAARGGLPANRSARAFSVCGAAPGELDPHGDQLGAAERRPGNQHRRLTVVPHPPAQAPPVVS